MKINRLLRSPVFIGLAALAIIVLMFSLLLPEKVEETVESPVSQHADTLGEWWEHSEGDAMEPAAATSAVETRRRSFFTTRFFQLFQTAIILLLAALSYYLWRQNEELAEITETHQKKLRKLEFGKDKSAATSAPDRKNFVEVKQYNSFRQQNENKLFTMEHTLKELQQDVTAMKQKAEEEEARRREAARQPTKLYFPPPLKEGVFPVDQGSTTFRPGTSVYLLEVDPDEDEQATFCFYEDKDAMQRAINYSDSIIKQACEMTDLGPARPASIKTIEAGKAIRKEGSWVIQQKAKIRYE